MPARERIAIMIKIVVDAMGGDNAPGEIVKGAVLALSEREDFSLILTGDETLINAELKQYKYDASRVEVIACSEVITNDDMPTLAVRQKKDSSLVVGMKKLKEDDEVAGFVSAGSTGAVLTGGIMLLGRIKGVIRPALCPALPNVHGTRTLLCDCGANAECKPPYLVQFGIMAAAYAKAAYGVENPRVGLLTNGTEEHKGDPLHQEAHQLLKKTDCLNFVGNVEGRDIMYGDIDVAVADGFSGNLSMKAIEGCGKMVGELLSKQLKSSLRSKIGALFMMKQLKAFKNHMDYSRYGGSVFLGLKKVVIKSHGSSKAKSITASVLQAVEAHKNHLIETIEEMLQSTLAEGSADA